MSKLYASEQDARALANCENCPLNGLPMVLPEGEDDPTIAVIQNQPSPIDHDRSRPMLDKAGIAVRTTLLKAGHKPLFTYNVLCGNGTKDEKSNPAAAAACRPRLEAELASRGVNRILLMGKAAASGSAMFGKPVRAYKDVADVTHTVGPNTYRVSPAATAIAKSPAAHRSFVDDIEGLVNPTKLAVPDQPETEQYFLIENANQALRVFDDLGSPLAVDIETTGLDPFQDQILTIQVSDTPGIGYAFPFSLFEPIQWAWLLFAKRLVMHRGTFDSKVLQVNGVLANCHYDTRIEHYLLDERVGTHALEQLAPRYLGSDKWGHLVSDPDGKMDIQSASKSNLAEYGARDADLTLRLHKVFYPNLRGRFIHKVLTDFQNSMVRTEIRGIKVDRDKLNDMIEQGESFLGDAEQRLADQYGLENPRSHKQVADVLFDRLGLFDVSGKRSTSEEYLDQYVSDIPFVRDLLEYRHTHKATATYLRNLDQSTKYDGRYHPQYDACSTVTGRLSEPLILLVPRAEDLKNPDFGQRLQLGLRDLFIADEGKMLVQQDARGAEIHMGAHLSADPLMTQHLNEDVDLHSVIAIQAFDLGIDLEPYATLKERVSESHAHERSMAKTGVFAVMFGGGAATVARQLGVTLEVGTSIVSAIRDTYAGFQEWREAVIATARESGSLTTPWGRTRRFSFGAGLAKHVEEEQEREAVNFLIQSMANDWNLLSFVEAETQGLETLFTVHDSIVIQTPEEEVEKIAKRLKSISEGIIKGAVQFKADIKWGPSWGAAE